MSKENKKFGRFTNAAISVLTAIGLGLSNVACSPEPAPQPFETCGDCLLGGAYKDIIKYYHHGTERKVRVINFATEYSDWTIYNYSNLQFSGERAKALIEFWETLGRQKAVVDFKYWYPDYVYSVRVGLTSFRRHIFIVAPGGEMISLRVTTPQEFQDDGTTTVMETGPEPVEEYEIADVKIPYRNTNEQTNARFAVASCLAVLGSPENTLEALDTSIVCELMGNASIYSSRKIVPWRENLFEKFFARTQNGWEEHIKGMPINNLVFP